MARKSASDIQREIALIAAVITDFYFTEMHEYVCEKRFGGYHFALDKVVTLAIKLEKQTRKIAGEDWEEELEKTGDLSWEDYIARLAEDELLSDDYLPAKVYYAVWAEDSYLDSGLNAKTKKDVKEAILSLIEPDTDVKDFRKFKKMTIEEICAVKGWKFDANPQPISTEESDL